jgi:hypothetical protein
MLSVYLDSDMLSVYLDSKAHLLRALINDKPIDDERDQSARFLRAKESVGGL